jgi:hypothetical protein
MSKYIVQCGNGHDLTGPIPKIALDCVLSADRALDPYERLHLLEISRSKLWLANHIRARHDHVPRPGFDADVYVVLDNFERFFWKGAPCLSTELC